LTLASGVILAVGLAVLLAGRHLFWLFVGATGFAVGLRWAATALAGQSEWVVIGVALALGVAGALLAIVFQWLAVAVAGFLAGVHGALGAAPLLGVSEDLRWVVAIAGGIVAAALLLWLWDWVLVILSALVGAALVVQVPRFGPAVTLLVFIGLFVIGVAVQASFFAPARGETGPGSRGGRR
jgi:hypothetical protein